MRSGGAQNILRPETARVINENPFAGLNVSALSALNSLEIVSGAIAKFRPDPQLQKPQAMARPSAVLIGLFQSARGVEVIREMQEEIGINPSEARVIAELSAISTVVSNSHIVPIVARFVERPKMQPMNSEVDRVFTVPLSELIRSDTYSQEHWKFPDRELQINFFYLDDETIWGATARMLLQVMKLTLKL